MPSLPAWPIILIITILTTIIHLDATKLRNGAYFETMRPGSDEIVATAKTGTENGKRNYV
jgi:hypothetical protein